MSAAFTDAGSGNSELEFLNSILFSEDFPSHVVLMIQYGCWSCVPESLTPRGGMLYHAFHHHNLHLSITLTTCTCLSHSPPAPHYIHTHHLHLSTFTHRAYKTSLHCCFVWVFRMFTLSIATPESVCDLTGSTQLCRFDPVAPLSFLASRSIA